MKFIGNLAAIAALTATAFATTEQPATLPQLAVDAPHQKELASGDMYRAQSNDYTNMKEHPFMVSSSLSVGVTSTSLLAYGVHEATNGTYMGVDFVGPSFKLMQDFTWAGIMFFELNASISLGPQSKSTKYASRGFLFPLDLKTTSWGFGSKIGADIRFNCGQMCIRPNVGFNWTAYKSVNRSSVLSAGFDSFTLMKLSMLQPTVGIDFVYKHSQSSATSCGFSYGLPRMTYQAANPDADIELASSRILGQKNRMSAQRMGLKFFAEGKYGITKYMSFFAGGCLETIRARGQNGAALASIGDVANFITTFAAVDSLEGHIGLSFDY